MDITLYLPILKFFAPTILLHATLKLLSYRYLLHIPTSVFVAIWFFTRPVYNQIYSNVITYIHTKKARKLGAKLVPAVRGEWPGGIDVFYQAFGKKNLYLGDGIYKWFQKHGTTFAMTIFGETRILTINPENVKQVLATDFHNYVKGEIFNKTMASVLGVGIFNCDGGLWQFHRSITRPFFVKERVTDFSIFNSKANIALQKMQERFQQGLAVDFQDVCSRFTLDSACEFLLGASVDTLMDPFPQPGEIDSHLSTPSTRFSRAFANAQIVVASRGRFGPVWRLRELFKDKTKDDMVIIRDFIEPIVRAAISRHLQQSNDVSLLDHLVSVTDARQEDDLTLIVDEVINIMVAGRDTTASLITFATYCLAMHPDVLSRLREEIINTVGKDNPPTLDHLRSLKFLRAVLNETLRLYSPVPFNIRQTRRATTFVNDEGEKLYVPARTRVAFPIMLMHRHEGYWGADAHLWDPDRFLDERVKKTVTTNPFIFLPFNAGPRICLGQQFAYHEASFFIVRMLQRFEHIELAPECQSPDTRPPVEWTMDDSGSPRKKLERCWPKSHLTLYVHGGLWVRMKASDQ